MGVKLLATSGGSVELVPTNTASNFVATVPAVTGNVVLDSATQTLTNKTITGAVISSMASSVVTSGTPWTYSTPVTSIDFTSIPSWVKRITVMFQGVSTNGTSAPQIQIGSGSVTTTGYLGSNSLAINAATTAATLFTSGFGIGVNTSNWTAAMLVHGSVQITLISGNTWVATGSVGRSDAGGTFFTNGSVALGGTLDRVRVTTVGSTDTFDAGSINILYE